MLITAWPAEPIRRATKNHNSEIKAMGITQANSSDESRLGRTPRYCTPALSSMGTQLGIGHDARSVRKLNDCGPPSFSAGAASPGFPALGAGGVAAGGFS